jgi:REP element-mobilizing transposase RayT
MATRSRRSTQLSLFLPVSHSWGGRRPGAGRKRIASRPLTPHRARPLQSPLHPVLITLRACFRPLRSQHVLPTLRLAIAGANRRAADRFRITHSSIQYDHIHLIVEASDKPALSSGMRSVAIRMARLVNALVRRRGRFWADRWHGRALTTPRQVRTALVYVLANFRKHTRRALGPGIDPYSSGACFDGWRGGLALANGVARELVPPRSESVPVSRPRTWLARVGWRRYGLLGLDESPRRAPKRLGGNRVGASPAGCG